MWLLASLVENPIIGRIILFNFIELFPFEFSVYL